MTFSRQSRGYLSLMEAGAPAGMATTFRRPGRTIGKSEGIQMTSGHAAEQVRERVDTIYRTESRRILATLIRLLGDFDLAEDALHDAFRAALERWPKEGVPANPRAWLISTGRFKAIDAMRRRVRLDDSQEAISEQL